jgi:hypothetical protein
MFSMGSMLRDAAKRIASSIRRILGSQAGDRHRAGRPDTLRALQKEELHMSNPKPVAQGSGVAKEKLTFKQMSGGQKAVFILKLAVCILSFGMVFPNLMND